jgi:hypothetical protein
MLMVVSLAVFAFLVYLAARAPVKGLPDYDHARESRSHHALTLPAVGLVRGSSTRGEDKSLEAPAAGSPQAVRSRLRLRRRVA